MSSLQDRHFVVEVLSGRIQGASPNITTVALRMLETSEKRTLASSGTPWIICLVVIAIIFSLFFLFLGQFLVLPLAIASGLSMFGVVIASWIWASSRESRIYTLEGDLHNSHEELQGVRNYLESCLMKIDQRRTKYFNSAPVSDSYTFFILMQIRDAIDQRLQELSPLLSRRSLRDYLLAHSLLSKPLVVRDSVIEGLGGHYYLSLSRIPSIVAPLLAHLQQNLLAIEYEQAELSSKDLSDPDSWEAA